MPNEYRETLTCPFGELATNLSESELRETAYEILVGACGKTSTNKVSDSGAAATATATPQASLTSRAASKVKKALGLRSRRKKSSATKAVPEPVLNLKATSIEETLRVQMGVSEQMDSFVRKALSKLAADQKMESIVLPLEMLQQLKPADFPTQQEYQASQKKNLKLLEAGLLLHPLLPLDKDNTEAQRLREIIHGAPDTLKNNDSMQALRSIVTSLACRASVPGTTHWADGFPLNLKIYQLLLEACFDVNNDASVVEELDDVLELIKKSWPVLGMNQMLHNLCFLWILFNRYAITDQSEVDLLNASEDVFTKVESDAKAFKEDVNCAKMLTSISSSILGWAEKRLIDYQTHFHSDNTELMQSMVSLAVLSSTILAADRVEGDGIDVGYKKADEYIKSSMRAAFSQVMEKEKSSKCSSKDDRSEFPLMARLAEGVSKVGLREKETFSPILKRWHPLAAGVAVATLHSCYGNELKQCVSGVRELSPEILQVLKHAERLEKDLVQIAVENSVDSEDGGKSIIREMHPYEAESVTSSLVKSWITERTDRLKEWVSRNLQQERWDPKATREHFALSAVEVLRIVDEAFEAFLLLPISMHAALLPDLAAGMDACLQQYISMAKSGCGTQTFVPTMPALTRCSRRSKLGTVFKRKEKGLKKTQGGIANDNDSCGTPQMCCRINTLHYMQTQLDGLAKREIAHLTNSLSTQDISNGLEKAFKPSAAACEEGIQQLCEATANKVIFHDLTHLFWDGLYIGEVSSSRIEPFLEELDHHLEHISLTVHDKVRTRVITQVMKVSFDGFLLVLLAGGPARAFTLQDYEMIEEDFGFLIDLFWSNGDGLPSELIDKFSITVKLILPLFQTDTESLIEKFRNVTLESCSSSTTKSKLPLPPTTGQWGPIEPNTVLRVLCYRNDEMAAKFLKKTYHLPKKL